MVLVPSDCWENIFNCDVCLNNYSNGQKFPISFKCGHVICDSCAKLMVLKTCPLDFKTNVSLEIENMEANRTILNMVRASVPEHTSHPPAIACLPDEDKHHYDEIIKNTNEIAKSLKYVVNEVKVPNSVIKRFIRLVKYSLLDAEGRTNFYENAFSLGERVLNEIFMLNHKIIYEGCDVVSVIKSKGGPFFGSTNHYMVLKIVLNILGDDSWITKKLLIDYISQCVEEHHTDKDSATNCAKEIIEILFKAACFQMEGRPNDAPVWQLREQYRNYTELKKIHDMEIIKMTLHSGLKISLEQWSSLFYGDPLHTAEVQSMVDKLVNHQIYMRSVSETYAYYQSTKPKHEADLLCSCLHILSGTRGYKPNSFTWQELEHVAVSLFVMMREMLTLIQITEEKIPLENRRNTTCLNNYMIQNITNNSIENLVGVQSEGSRSKYFPKNYKNSMCCYTLEGKPCLRGSSCYYAHSVAEREFWCSARESGFKNLP